MDLVRKISQSSFLQLVGLTLVYLVLIVPGIGSFGLWEPQELHIADHARSLQLPSSPTTSLLRWTLPDHSEARAITQILSTHDRQQINLCQRQPGTLIQSSPFRALLIQASTALLGKGEFGARIPFAILALITLWGIYYLGNRFVGPRAGLCCALVLLSCPLFVFQARQLTSNLAVVCGSTLVLVGITGLLVSRASQLLSAVCSTFLILLGALLSYLAGGALVGLVVPFIAGAFLASAHSSLPFRKHISLTLLCASIGLAALIGTLLQVFSLAESPTHNMLFGKTIAVSHEYHKALGGAWLNRPNTDNTFNALFEQIAFGMFPWSALAPVAILSPLLSAKTSSNHQLGAILALSWAAIAWIVATVLARNVGPIVYPGFPAIALATGLWMDNHWRPKDDRQAQPPSLHLVALFVILGVLVLSKNLQLFPDKLASIHIVEDPIKYPQQLLHRHVVFGFGVVFAALFGLGWWYPNWPASVLITGVIFGLFLTHAWTPALSRQLSAKDIFASYHERKQPGDKLGILGGKQSCIQQDYYVRDPYRTLASRSDMLAFLRTPQRTFALVPTSELCSIHRDNQDTTYFVLDLIHNQRSLLSNQLLPGEFDRNPLAKTIVRQRPKEIQRVIEANFDDRIELIGVNMPATIDRGNSFPMTLFFQVHKPIHKHWQIFVHFDAKQRFQGDHEPIQGHCKTNIWRSGDYIIDNFTVTAGNLSFAKTRYRVHIGFFHGTHGNWQNMPVVSGQKDDNNRVFVGEIILK